MTDTKAPSPWFDVIKGLLPSLNQCLIVIVTAAVTWFGTTRLTPPPPPPRVVEVIKTVPDAGSTLQRLSVIEGKLDQFLAAEAARKGKRKAVTATVK